MTRIFAVGLLAFASLLRAEDTEGPTPFITTPDEVVERMLELAGTRADDVVMDLGSGDGRIVIAAAGKYGARAVGVELDERLVALSRENARRAGVQERASFEQGDVLATPLARASVVTVYLLPQLMGQLQVRFIDELKPGSRIVSHSFTMAGWKPDRAETMRIVRRHPGQGDESTLYLWIVPADVRGRWEAPDFSLRINQNYQQLEIEGASAAQLSGVEIAWQSPSGSFQGRVEGDRIRGNLVTADGASRALVLERRR